MHLQRPLLNITISKNSDIITLLELIKQTEALFVKLGIAQARREAEEVIAYTLNRVWHELYLYYEQPIEKGKRAALIENIQRRAQREPLPYITEKVEFAGATLWVSPAVLIPRVETEILVEKIAQTLAQKRLEGQVLWDVCCGSGSIGIALKKRFPELTVFLSDLCEEALIVAKKNALLNKVEVHLLQGDLLIPFGRQACDYFVCNPPYISEKEMATLPPEVRHFEPHLALKGGKTGLEFYERLAKDLRSPLKLKKKGWLEIGYNQGKAIQSLFENQGWGCIYETDWSAHDRFVTFIP